MGVFEIIKEREIEAIRNEGRIQGRLEAQTVVVKNFLLTNKYTTAEIADLINVTEDFVINIKLGLK